MKNNQDFTKEEDNSTEEDCYKKLSHTWNDLWAEKELTVSARFKRPNVASIKRMQTIAQKDTIKASHNLLLDCLHPDDKETFLQDIEKYPALITTFSAAIIEGCGVSNKLGN